MTDLEPERLERWALDYLGRYASSAENLRRVLLRRARRHGAGETAVAGLIEALVGRYLEAGLLDDAAYAAARARTLYRRGDSLAAIRVRLAAKGLAAEVVLAALGELRAGVELADPDLAAACAFARRRRLGPYRLRPAERARELGAFARAGFSRQIAEAVLACRDAAAAESLARSGPD